MQAVNNISVIAMSNSSKPIKFPHFQKLANQAMLHRAHVIEMAKTSSVALMKTRSSLSIKYIPTLKGVTFVSDAMVRCLSLLPSFAK